MSLQTKSMMMVCGLVLQILVANQAILGNVFPNYVLSNSIAPVSLCSCLYISELTRT